MEPSETLPLIGNFCEDFPFRKIHGHDTPYYLEVKVLLIDLATIFC